MVRHMWWPLISRSEMKGLICGCSVDQEPHLQLREETGSFAPAMKEAESTTQPLSELDHD